MTDPPGNPRTARTARTAWRWAAWALIVVASGAGLRNYRIDNDIARWTPHLTGSAANADFVLIGFERKAVDRAALTGRLAGNGTRLVIPVAGAGTMDGLLVVGAPADDGRLLPAVRDALGADAERVALAGPSVFRAALDDWSQRGLSVASGLILVFGAIVMGVTTRRLRPAIEATVAVFSSQIALVGLISATGTPMDMVLSMTPPLLMGLGFSFAAHRATRQHVGPALRLSAITTGVALASFAFTDFLPIRSFALWGAAGIALTWCAVRLVVTAPTRNAGQFPARTAPARAGRRSTGWAWPVVLIGAIVTAAGLLVLPRLQMREDTIAYFPPEARIARDYRRLDRELTGTLPFHVVVDGLTADPAAMIRSTEGVGLVVQLPPVPGATSRTWFALARSDAVPALGGAQPAWHDWARAHETSLAWGGVAAQIDHIGRTVWQTATRALPAMLLVAGLAAFAVDRRWSSAALSVWINGFPVAAIGLLLYVSGRFVGLPTLMISALAVGVAIDDTLHLLVARRELGSFRAAVGVCGRACIGSSVAMAACMLTFLICPFRPTAEFGVLMAGSVLAALAGDLLLLPAAAQALLREPSTK